MRKCWGTLLLAPPNPRAGTTAIHTHSHWLGQLSQLTGQKQARLLSLQPCDPAAFPPSWGERRCEVQEHWAGGQLTSSAGLWVRDAARAWAQGTCCWRSSWAVSGGWAQLHPSAASCLPPSPPSGVKFQPRRHWIPGWGPSAPAPPHLSGFTWLLHPLGSGCPPGSAKPPKVKGRTLGTGKPRT